ncbi:hypothetical protein SFRURICE_016917, partial [Spodoptera frugiperda]
DLKTFGEDNFDPKQWINKAWSSSGNQEKECASCNIVIDEMLAYIQNKVSVIDEDTLVRICISSFSKEEIEKSKLLLFESVPGNLIKRKNKGKEERDLADIVQVFKSKEPDLFPIYVARELERLPPVLFDHLDCTKLLKDLLKLQEEMKNIKSTYVSQSQFEQLRSELLQMKNDSLLPNPENVNKRRGAWVLDSGPEMNLAASSANVLNVNSNQNNYGDNNHNDWHVVQKRKKPSRYRYTGSAGLCRDSEGKFKAADRNIPIFITRIHNDTTDKDIIDYVYNKTKEMITLERISFKYEREYKAYKFFISESKSTLFLDSGLWPQGIIFRRFVNFKHICSEYSIKITAIYETVDQCLEGAMLQQKLLSLEQKVQSVEEQTGHSIESLQKIDTLKSRLENAASALREADKWAALATSLEDILESGVPTQGDKLAELAEQVAAMTASLEVDRTATYVSLFAGMGRTVSVDWLTNVLKSETPVTELIRLYTDLLLSLDPSPTKITSKYQTQTVTPSIIRDFARAAYAPLRELLPKYTELQTRLFLDYLNDPQLNQEDLLELSRSILTVSERCEGWLSTAFSKVKRIAGEALYAVYMPAVENFASSLSNLIAAHSRRIESAFLSSASVGQHRLKLVEFLVKTLQSKTEDPLHDLPTLLLDPEVRQRLASFRAEPPASAAVLRRTKDQLRNLARVILRNPIDVQLDKIPQLSIGQYLMTLPQHLEMHLSEKQAPLQFLSEVCTHTCEVYAEKILNIRNMDALGTKRIPIKRGRRFGKYHHTVLEEPGEAEVHITARNAAIQCTPTFHHLCYKSHVIWGEPIAIY